MKQHDLVGKGITAIHLADDRKAIKFDIEGGDPIVAKCYGDCCSSTWVENIENPEAVLGRPVLSAENIDLPKPVDAKSYDDDGETIAYYGFKIETAGGACVIDYRNASNGYYGGNLSWPSDDYFYGGVHEQNVSKEVWCLIAPQKGTD